ncbi:MAG TPA: rhodanese-like domain-containing protein, partial [Candidatus Andersenbacteria bacterium]|nr:rhodanese-like domain-containing protein [Candidatus Andersenbacteria bacterium]
SFQEFPEFIEKSSIPKDKPVAMYCTSGIRCEKAAEEMRSQGYENVYQLDGGITNYLREYPDGAWQGECFVFDHRSAIDSHLQPSTRYSLCASCGNPGDVKTACTACTTACVMCELCLQKLPAACSKACKRTLEQVTSPKR